MSTSTRRAPRGQRLVEHAAATTTDPNLKRLLNHRTLEDVSPAYNRFLLNASPAVDITTPEEFAALKQKQQQAGNDNPDSSSSTSGNFWTPSQELIKIIRRNPDAEEEFQTMRLSRVLCRAISQALDKPVTSTLGDDKLPTRVSRLVVPASVQQQAVSADDEEGENSEHLLLIHSCAAVIANKIVTATNGGAALVWIVENNSVKDEVETVLEAVFGLEATNFVVLSAAARKAVNLAETSLLSHDAAVSAAAASSPSAMSGSARRSRHHNKKRHLFVVTTTSSSGVNVNRALGETIISATESNSFRSSQILIFGDSEKVIKNIQVGDCATNNSATEQGQQQNNTSSSSKQQQKKAFDTVTPRKLYYAVADGFGNFFAICKLLQNLSRGQRAVIHFATRHSAMFFIDSFYALQNKSDSLLGAASNLTLICDAENVPKRIECAAGESYDELLQRHVAAAASRFTNLKEDRTGVYISGFGVVPDLNDKITVNGTKAGIFIQAESLPDVALATSSLFLAHSSPLNDPRQYKTNICFVSPAEVKGGLPAAIEETLLTTTTAQNTTTATTPSRRERDSEVNGNKTSSDSSSSSLWSLTQLPLSSILRGTTDKSTNLNQVLEAREFQSLVRKIFALNAGAYEAYRSYCLFYQTMCFGYHLDQSVSALRQFVGDEKFGLGPKVAAWYEFCQKTAIDSVAFAGFLNLESQAHRFGLETPPLLDLRTKDTSFRPRRDLYRFAITAKITQDREFKQWADVALHKEAPDSDEEWEE